MDHALSRRERGLAGSLLVEPRGFPLGEQSGGCHERSLSAKLGGESSCSASTI